MDFRIKPKSPKYLGDFITSDAAIEINDVLAINCDDA